MRKFAVITGEIGKMPHPAKRFCALGMLLWAFWAGAPGPATPASVTIDRIIAKVNDEIITLSDLQDLAKPGVDNLRKNHKGDELNRRMRALELELLDLLIENKLILQRAGALKVEVDEKEVENAIAAVLRENKITTAGLRNFLSAQGVTIEKYREDIRKRLLTRRVANMEVGVRVTVGEQEIADYHAAHAEDYREAEKRTVRQIFFPLASGAPPAEIEAQRKKAALAHARATRPGADFAQVAREVSEGPTRSRGGSLGVLKKGEVFPELEQLIFSTKQGETSQPVRTRVGFHVIRVEKVEPGKLIALDRVAGRIRSKLYAAKFAKRRREWIAELKRTAFLEIHYDPKASGGGLASIFKDVREQVTFHLVGIRLRESRGLLGRDRIFWTYGAQQRSPRWKSDRLRVDDARTLGKDEIGALAAAQRSFVNPDPSASIYLFSHRYLFPDSYIGKVGFADMMKAHSLQAGAGAEKARIALETDTKAARLEFEVEVQNTRSIVADPKEIAR